MKQLFIRCDSYRGPQGKLAAVQVNQFKRQFGQGDSISPHPPPPKKNVIGVGVVGGGGGQTFYAQFFCHFTVGKESNMEGAVKKHKQEEQMLR